MKDQYLMSCKTDRSILAPSPFGEGWGGASHLARSDPSLIARSRGDPSLLFCSHGDPPEVFRLQGQPRGNRGIREGPQGTNGALGNPPEMKIIRNSSIKQELIFRITGRLNESNRSGMPVCDVKNERASVQKLHQSATKETPRNGVGW